MIATLVLLKGPRVAHAGDFFPGMEPLHGRVLAVDFHVVDATQTVFDEITSLASGERVSIYNFTEEEVEALDGYCRLYAARHAAPEMEVAPW